MDWVDTGVGFDWTMEGIGFAWDVEGTGVPTGWTKDDKGCDGPEIDTIVLSVWIAFEYTNDRRK